MLIRCWQSAISASLLTGLLASPTIGAEAQLLFSTPAQVFLMEVTLTSEAGKDVTLPLIFDTGAAVTILDDAILQALGATPLGTEAIMLPDGTPHQINHYRLASVQLGDCTLRNVDVYGSPGIVQGVLGLDLIGPLLPLSLTSEAVSFACPTPLAPTQ